MSHRLSTRRRASAVVVLLLTLVVATATPASAVEARARRSGLTVTTTSTSVAFSPNGDGSKDVGGVRYRLSKRAYVTVRVSHGGTTVLLRRAGRVRSGTHYFAWNGTSKGRVVPDATYSVRIVARTTRHGKAHVAYGALTVDARYGNIGLRHPIDLSSNVVYPRTTEMHDMVVGVFDPYDNRTGSFSAIRRQVVDPSGRVIDSTPLEAVPGSLAYRYTWDGRNSAGQIVRAGTYRLRLVQGRDRAGNPRVLQPPQPVTVSTEKLVARTTTLSRSALDLARTSRCYTNPAPYDCGGERTRSVPSTRFSGGVSYRSEQRALTDCAHDTGCHTYTVWTDATDIYSLDVSGRGTPYDTFSVTAHGGPATAGDSDVGTLSAYTSPSRTGVPSPAAVQMQGDASSTLSDVHSLGMTPYRESDYSYPSVDPPQLRWYVGAGDGNEYDVSSFDITWTRYVPAS